MELKLWLVSRKDHVGWEEYEAIVCAAETEEEALKVNPGPCDDSTQSYWDGYEYSDGSPVILKATCIGTALPGMQSGTVILASYKAG